MRVAIVTFGMFFAIYRLAVWTYAYDEWEDEGIVVPPAAVHVHAAAAPQAPTASVDFCEH